MIKPAVCPRCGAQPHVGRHINFKIRGCGDRANKRTVTCFECGERVCIIDKDRMPSWDEIVEKWNAHCWDIMQKDSDMYYAAFI